MSNNANNDRFQRDKYSLGSKFKEKISQFFYYHGLNCSRHPYLLIIFSILLFCFCCYPIFGIHLFQNDFSQQFVTNFDTFRDLHNLNSNSSTSSSSSSSSNDQNRNSTFHTINGRKILREAPRWFNFGKPHAYVMQIIVQSSVIPWKENLILMDAIRAPIAQVFSIVEIISNYQIKTDQHSSTLNDVCLQVAEPIMLKDEIAFSYLPRYSCLTLSPANVWKNDLNKFLKDAEIIKTIFDIKDTSSLESGSLKELLFGLSWIQTGIRKLYVRTRQRKINYAITLVFKEFNEEFIQSLKRTLKQKFPGTPFKSENRSSAANEFLNSKTVHLYFQNQKNFTEFLPLALAYFLVFMIIYFSVRRIDLIKNKFMLAFSSVMTIVLSLLSSIGICFWLEFNPTLNGSDILPYLVVLVGFENIIVLIKSIASTPDQVDLKVRMAQGLSNQAWSIINNFSVLYTLLLLGFLTFIPLIQDICLFGIVALTSDLILQLMFFLPILAKQLNKMSKSSQQTKKGHKKNLSASKPITFTLKNSNSETNLQKQLLDSQSPTKIYARPSSFVEPKKEPKRLRFIYFIANHRMIHKLMVLTFIAWIMVLSFSTFRFTGIKTKLEDGSPSIWNLRSFTDIGQKDKLNFEKHEFTKNKFLFSHFLSSQHWSTLFWSYNISLSGKYITILPALQLSIPVTPEKAIETRHLLESDPQIFRQYFFSNLNKIPLNTDSIDDYEDEILYKNLEINKWSKKSIVFTSILLLVVCFIIIYLLTSLYRCICTRSYPEWRSSWFKNDKSNCGINGKNFEDLVLSMEALPIKFKAHEQEIEYLCASISSQTVVSCDLQGDVKIWDILTMECKTFIQRSIDKTNKNTSFQKQLKQRREEHLNGSSFGSDSTLSSSLSNGDDNEIITAINENNQHQINRSTSNGLIHVNSNSNNKKAENSGYDFTKFYHKSNFSNNFISKFIYNANKQSNSNDKAYNDNDISSQANVNVISELKFQSIWSIFQNDKLVFLGCSNGRFEVWHQTSGELCYYNETCDSGITVMGSNNHKLVIARLSGFIEIYEQELKSNSANNYANFFKSNHDKNVTLSHFNISNLNTHHQQFNANQSTNTESKSLNYITFKYLQTINAHKQPINCLKIDDKYMVTGSADNLIRVFKFEQLICSPLFTLHGHFAAITCLEIDRSSNSAVSGCDLGQVCVWDLITGTCIFSLEAHNDTITEILITNLYIISGSMDYKINIMDKYSGNLVNTINYQYSLCQKMIIMTSNILVTVNDDELHLWDISEAKKIKVVKIGGDERFSLVRNLSLSFKSRAIVCDYGTDCVFIHFSAKNFFKTFKCPEHIKTKFKPATNRFGQFVVYSAAFYNWDEQGVTDHEIKSTIQEFVYTSKVFFDQRSKRLAAGDNDTQDRLVSRSTLRANNNELLKHEWEAVLVQDNYQVWRRKLDKSGLYRYKVFGTFHDIPAKTFLNVQMDTEYRKKWDSLIVKLNILDKEKNENINFKKSLNEINYFDTGNEVLQWVMKYPYPMYSREYCYIRRAIVCNKENLIVLISKSCDHPKCNEQSNPDAVRVIDYESQMVIRPHSTFDENGFDYLLTYFDDPRAYLPCSAYTWITSSGLPGFVESLHRAALELNKKVNNVKNQFKDINKENGGETNRETNKKNTREANSSKDNNNNKKSSSTYAIKTNTKSSSTKHENNKSSYSEVVFN